MGDLADAISTSGETVDLIVCCSATPGGRFSLRSIPDKVMRRMETPVLLMQAERTEFEFSRIVLPLDVNDLQPAGQLLSAFELVEAIGLPLKVVVVQDIPRRTGGDEPPALNTEGMDALTALLSDRGHEVPPLTIEGEAWAQVGEYCRPDDLLALVHARRGHFWTSLIFGPDPREAVRKSEAAVILLEPTDAEPSD